jgi:hypothetical protein
MGTTNTCAGTKVSRNTKHSLHSGTTREIILQDLRHILCEAPDDNEQLLHKRATGVHHVS